MKILEEDNGESLLVKGMAKFYTGLDILLANNFLNFPTKEKLNTLSRSIEDKFKCKFSDIFYMDYDEMKNKHSEKMGAFEKDFAESGCISKFLFDVEDGIVISNQDNFNKSQKHMCKSTITKSDKSLSDNGTSPNNYKLEVKTINQTPK
jgi:hypothetical protein